MDIDGSQGYRIPCSECKSDETTDCTDGKDMPVALCNVHGGLEHENTEGDSRDPADEAEDAEDGE